MIPLVDRVTLWFDKSIEAAVANRKRLLIGAVGLVVVILGLIGFSYYREWIQTSAQKSFSEALRYYDAPIGAKTVITNGTIEFGSDAEKWKKVAEVFDAGYHQHRSAGIAPLFRAYYAEAILNLGKLDEAIDIMAATVPAIASRELQEFYALKLALMKIDSPKFQAEGLEALTAFANDRSSTAHEAGLYYLGNYYWALRNFEQARAYWQQLVVQYDKPDTKQQSGFALVVKARLKLISPEW